MPKRNDSDDFDDIGFEADEDRDLNERLRQEFGIDPERFPNYGKYIKYLIDHDKITSDEAEAVAETISPTGSVNVG